MPKPKSTQAIQQRPQMLFGVSEAAAPSQPGKGASVIVIGAGFAGLSAAYELHCAGYDVTVLEAQRRLGGRVQSLNDVVPGKNVEGGGELIGENHHAWLWYQQKFGLGLSDVHDGGNAPIFLRGRFLSKHQAKLLVNEMGDVFCELGTLAASITNPFRPWLSPNARALDGQSLRSWIRSTSAKSLCQYAVDLQFSTDNGVSANKQSMLGVLAMIRGGGCMNYFTDTERHRCKGGNQQLAAKLAEPLGDAVHLGRFVENVRQSGDGMLVDTIDWDKNKQTFKAKDVILAIPPSTWSKITFGSNVPHTLKPQMGKNVKCLMTVGTEYWKRSGLSPNLISDRALELTWESTEEQKGPGHALVGFSGADQAEQCIKWGPVKRTGKYLDEFSRAFPGSRKELIDARFKNWPEDPFVLASYAFPAPGEIMRCGPIYEQGIGNLHFAGEHTCYAFMGYMEGALQSGIRACNRIMVRDGLAPAIGIPAMPCEQCPIPKR